MRALPVGPLGVRLPVARRQLEGWPLADRPLVSFRIPPASIFKPGAYDVFVSVGTRTGTPQLELPLKGSDGQRRYHLGTVLVRPLARRIPVPGATSNAPADDGGALAVE